MKLIIVEASCDDHLHWQKTGGQKLKRLNQLINDIARQAFYGIGKPEPLKFNYAS